MFFIRDTHRKHPLWVSLCPHVGVVNLLQDHPAFVMFAILCAEKKGIVCCFNLICVRLFKDQKKGNLIKDVSHLTLEYSVIKKTKKGVM